MKINPSSWRLFFNEDEKVLAIPSWSMPRVYLPSRSIRQRWVDAGAFYPALRLRSKAVRLAFQFIAATCPRLFEMHEGNLSSPPSPRPFRRLLVAVVQRVRVLRHSALFQALVPEAYGLNQDQPVTSRDFNFSLDSWVGELPEYDHSVVLVGAAADDKQKLIIRLEGRNQQVLAYLKYAEQQIAQQKLVNEQKILNAIPTGHGPEIIKFGRFGEGKALLMTTVPGNPLPSRIPSAGGACGLDRISEFLKALESEQLVEVDGHPAIVRLRGQLANGKEQIVDGFLENLLEPLRKHRWPVVIQHGDLTPWNLYEFRGSLRAVDWEDGVADGFSGFDLVYLYAQTGYFLHQWPSEKVFRVAEAALQGSLSHEERTAIVRLSALDAFLRGQSDGMSDDHPLQLFRLEMVNLTAS